MPSFASCKDEFNNKYSKKSTFMTIVPVDGKRIGSVIIKNKKGENNEEYYNGYIAYYS